jgi:hypothetical protein
MWLTVCFACAAVLFGFASISALWHLQWVKRLPPRLPNGGKQRLPSVTMVIPARNEADRIEMAVRHALAQVDVELNVIVVDDRSTDGTPAILRALAAEQARLEVLRVDELPAGWLGKCYACHLGANRATGDWLLFSDADCWLAKDVVARALLAAERTAADHIALTPGVLPHSIFGAAWQLVFAMGIGKRMSAVNRDRSRAHLGIGAFNLVGTIAYRECGGYEALRMTVVDDIKLGLLLRRCGKRTRAFIGGPDAECHWAASARAMIHVMEKNFFAAVDYRTPVALGAALFGTISWCAAIAGAFVGTPLGYLSITSLLSLSCPAAIYARRLGWGVAPALMTPFIYPLFFYAVLNSTIVTLRQGGVRWRGTFYSLDELRAGNVS